MIVQNASGILFARTACPWVPWQRLLAQRHSRKLAHGGDAAENMPEVLGNARSQGSAWQAATSGHRSPMCGAGGLALTGEQTTQVAQKHRLRAVLARLPLTP